MSLRQGVKILYNRRRHTPYSSMQLKKNANVCLDLECEGEVCAAVAKPEDVLLPRLLPSRGTLGSQVLKNVYLSCSFILSITGLEKME